MATRSNSKQPTLKQEAANENTSQARLRELAETSIELAQIVAKNFNVDSELLRELAASTDDLTREGVASNPNTPTEILWKLGEEFPKELLNNPVLSLLVLENPNLLADMPVLTLLSLIEQNEVPQLFIKFAAKSDNEQISLALLKILANPRIPKSVLENLVISQNAEIAQAAKLHINWTDKIGKEDEIITAAIKSTSLPKNREIEWWLYKIGFLHKELVLSIFDSWHFICGEWSTENCNLPGFVPT